MPYVEKDVTRDRAAAEEMVRRSGEMGVPVIAVDGSVVVGFDQPRLEQLLASDEGRRRRLGISVAPVSGGGLLIGQVHPGSLAAEAGLQRGDVILDINGQPVATAEQLQERFAQASGAARTRLRRDGRLVEVALPRH